MKPDKVLLAKVEAAKSLIRLLQRFVKEAEAGNQIGTPFETIVDGAVAAHQNILAGRLEPYV